MAVQLNWSFGPDAPPLAAGQWFVNVAVGAAALAQACNPDECHLSLSHFSTVSSLDGSIHPLGSEAMPIQRLWHLYQQAPQPARWTPPV